MADYKVKVETENGMTIADARDAIAYRLDGDAHEVWVGLDREGRNDFAGMVTAGDTVDNAVAQFEVWCQDWHL